MKIYMEYNFQDWNKYINEERTCFYKANNTKKREMDVVMYYTLGRRYEGKYPVKMTFTKYFQDKRKDLDNCRLKGLIDGLVKCGVIKNDNLNCIQEIVLKSAFDKTKEGILIEIEEMENGK